MELVDAHGKAINEMWGPTMIIRWSKAVEGKRTLMQLWQSNQGKFIWKAIPTEEEVEEKALKVID